VSKDTNDVGQISQDEKKSCPSECF